MRYSLATELISRPGTVALGGNPLSRVCEDQEWDWAIGAIDAITTAKRVNIDDLAGRRFEGTAKASTTPLMMRPSFDEMWFEYELAEDTSDSTIGRQKVGALVYSNDDQIEDLCQAFNLGFVPSHVVTMVVFGQNTEGLFLVGAEDYLLDSEYTYKSRIAHDTLPIDTLMRTLTPAKVAEIRNVMLASLHNFTSPVASAMGMLNCGNVKLQPTETSTKRKSSKKSSRRELPEISFSTIRLPGIQYERNGRVAPGSAGEMRQHLVRGHQKRFTADAPLLGKHVGTYWWKPQARGNAGRGKVVTDYVVSHSAAAAA